MHAAVEGVLPPERQGRVLWRLERNGPHASLLVQSPERPSLEHVVEQAGWPDATGGAPRIADLEPLLFSLARGRQFGFRARLNPVQNVPAAEGRSTRRGHRTLAHQLEWFTRRAQEDCWGFRLLKHGEEPTVGIVERERLRFVRDRGGAHVIIDTATFEGVIEVTNPSLLRNSLLNGIGSAKAYGCGLVTLATVSGHVVAR